MPKPLQRSNPVTVCHLEELAAGGQCWPRALQGIPESAEDFQDCLTLAAF